LSNVSPKPVPPNEKLNQKFVSFQPTADEIVLFQRLANLKPNAKTIRLA